MTELANRHCAARVARRVRLWAGDSISSALARVRDRGYHRRYFSAISHVAIGHSGSFRMASLWRGCQLLSGTPSNRSPSHTTIQTYGFPQPPQSTTLENFLARRAKGAGGKRQKLLGSRWIGLMKQVV